MLSKTLRKHLLEQEDWDAAINQFVEETDHSNRSLIWTRDTRDKGLSALHDLALLAQKLPDDKQAELFSPKILEELVRHVLHIGQEEGNVFIKDNRRLVLAAAIADISLEYCKLLYSALIDEKDLAKPTIEVLESSQRIAKALAKPRQHIEGKGYHRTKLIIDTIPRKKSKRKKTS